MNKETLWVLDADSQKFAKRDVNIVPGLYKIVDEIIVNAADNKVKICPFACMLIMTMIICVLTRRVCM